MPLLVRLEREGNIAYAATRAVCHSDSPRAVMLYIGARSYSLPNFLMARTSPVRECCHARIQEDALIWCKRVCHSKSGLRELSSRHTIRSRARATPVPEQWEVSRVRSRSSRLRVGRCPLRRESRHQKNVGQCAGL